MFCVSGHDTLRHWLVPNSVQPIKCVKNSIDFNVKFHKFYRSKTKISILGRNLGTPPYARPVTRIISARGVAGVHAGCSCWVMCKLVRAYVDVIRTTPVPSGATSLSHVGIAVAVASVLSARWSALLLASYRNTHAPINKSVFMSAVNVTMPVFAAERRRLLLIVFSCPWGTQQQTRCRCRSVGQTDGRRDSTVS